jgi:hypothetical protein
MKKTLLVAASAAMMLVAGHANAREFADIYTDCGLGAMIAPTNGAVAAVTNVTWDLGTTAISSNATSADTCNGGKAKTAAFLFQQYGQLENDLAQGEGKHLAALMTIAGCRADAAQTLRASLAASVASPDYAMKTRYEQAQGLYQQVQQASCHAG